jgi:hypothetical protein
MVDQTDSPYLKNPKRLSEVIAAIQVLGTYKYYKRSFVDWAEAISGDNKKEKFWKDIFLDHPEFFRIDSSEKRASLVWRRTYQKRYYVDIEKTVTKEQYDDLKAAGRADRISRTPLKNEDIKMLVDTAINLHSRALEGQKDKRWWVNIFMAFFGAILGAVIGSSTIIGKILN